MRTQQPPVTAQSVAASARRRRMRSVLLMPLVALALVVGSTSTATAGTFTNSYRGSDYQQGTTLLFGPHGNFYLEVKGVVDSCCFISDRYGIAMYNSSGTLLWSAGNQSRRSYYVGSNVYRIVIYRSATYGAHTEWRS